MNRGFRDHRMKECDINHGLETRQLWKSMGGMTDNITQSTLDGTLWQLRRGKVSRGSLVFGFLLDKRDNFFYRGKGGG